MYMKYSKFYQLGNGGDLIFERDLDQLSELLERPHPEFFGAQLNDQGGEDLQWIIVASLWGKIEPPTVDGIQFTLRENNWLDGLVSTPGYLIPDACYAIHRNPRITIFARHNRIGTTVHHPLQTIVKVLQIKDLMIQS